MPEESGERSPTSERTIAIRRHRRTWPAPLTDDRAETEPRPALPRRAHQPATFSRLDPRLSASSTQRGLAESGKREREGEEQVRTIVECDLERTTLDQQIDRNGAADCSAPRTSPRWTSPSPSRCANHREPLRALGLRWLRIAWMRSSRRVVRSEVRKSARVQEAGPACHRRRNFSAPRARPGSTGESCDPL